jgi:aminoglycoside phosphotransferase
MLPKLTARILDYWDTLMVGVEKPYEIKYLCIAGSVEGGTTTFLAFSDKHYDPLFAVKIHRHLDAKEKIANEIRIVSYLANCGTPISNSTPRLILSETFSGISVLIMSTVKGEPMVASLTKKGTPELSLAYENFNITSSWLENLYFSTKTNDDSIIEDLEEYSYKLINEFQKVFELSVQERISLQVIADNIENTTKNGIGVQHGDLCRQNILVADYPSEKKINVIDWTDSKRVGIPLHDLYYFLTTYFLQARSGKGLENIIQSFLNTYFLPNPYCKLVKDIIIKYVNKISMDPNNLSTLFGLFLIEQSLFEYKKMLKCSKYDTLPRFTFDLAKQTDSNFNKALKQQIWILFFRECVKKQIFINGNFLH